MCRVCLFIAIPDVVGDHTATLSRWHRYRAELRACRPRSFARTDALPSSVPWDECDAVFIGGTTSYKLSPTAEAICLEAKARGKWIHMGRVNSHTRLRLALRWGVDSIDGSKITVWDRWWLADYINLTEMWDGQQSLELE